MEVLSIGSSRTITYTFSTGGTYDICYTYRNSDGCEIQCCKQICVEDPYVCDRITKRVSGNNYVLSIPGVNSSDIQRWQDDSNGVVVANNTTQVTVPIPQECKYYSVYLYDRSSNCYRVCCIQICPCDVQTTEVCDLVSYSYAGQNGSFRYQFFVSGNTPTGTWTAQAANGTPINLGSGRIVTYTFNRSGLYTICYTYTTPDGCEKTCCKRIFIDNPYDCTRITKRTSGSNYVLTIPGINNSDVQRWQDDSNGNTVRTNTNELSVPIPTECKYYSVYFFDPATNCYRVCCIRVCPCNSQVDDNCNSISFSYAGQSGSLRYRFAVPSNTPNGSWTARQVSGGNTLNIGSSRILFYTFNTSGAYDICYVYTNSEGCQVTCCKRIYIDDPYNCNLATKRLSGGNYILAIPGISSDNVQRWQDDSDGSTVNTNNSQVTVPIPEVCKYYSVFFFDPATNCYRVCCIQVCPCTGQADNNCNSITFNYIGQSGNLRYQFDVPSSTPSGSWTAQAVAGGNVINLGSGHSRTYTFNTSGEYIICYTYTTSNGCQVTCCKRIYIDDPYNCNLITKRLSGGNYILEIPGISSDNIQRWQDDSNGATVNTNTSQITVPIPEVCKYYSVFFFDPATNCYRVCCIQICPCIGDEMNDNCNLISYRYTGGQNGPLQYEFSVPNTTPSGTWTQQQVGGSVFSMSTQPYTFPTAGEYIICYKYTNSNGCVITCCKRIYIENPYNCTLATKRPSGSNYILEIPGIDNANVQRWQDDSNGATVNTNSNQVTVPVPDSGLCKYYSVFFFDPVTNCYRVCCIQVCGPSDQPCCQNSDATLDYLIDLFDDKCTDCGAKIYCSTYNGQPSFYVHYGLNCTDDCDKPIDKVMVFDCIGKVLAIGDNISNLQGNLIINNLLWECDPTAPVDCCTNDPLTLPWLNTYINDWCQAPCRGRTIYCATLNGQPVIHLTPHTNCSDGLGEIKDCQGTTVATYGGIFNLDKPTSLIDVRWIWDDSNCLQSPETTPETSRQSTTTNQASLPQVEVVPTTSEAIRISNSPNPFNDYTDILFDLQEATTATIQIFDNYGHKVYEQANTWSKGENRIPFTPNMEHSSGIYLVKITGQAFSASHKIVLVK